MSSKAQTREKDYERGLRIADSRKAIGLSQDELAKDAKACYKVNQLVLVNLDIIDEYLETFHIVDDEFYK